MTRKRRLELNEKSMLAFGRALEWQKRIRKGHFIAEGKNKRWYPISISMIETIMNQIITKMGEEKIVQSKEVRQRETKNGPTKPDSNKPVNTGIDVRGEEIRRPQLAKGYGVESVNRSRTKAHFRMVGRPKR